MSIRLTIASALSLLFLISCTKEVKNSDNNLGSSNKSIKLTQFSSINSLLNGNYIGDASYKEIKSKGNFGLGTFNFLHGEMVALDGKFYQATVDGKVALVNDTLFAPFAAVHNFIPDSIFTIDYSINSYNDLNHFIMKYITNPNNIYAFRIHSKFDSLSVRSVPKQKLPFVPLGEVVKIQTVFNLQQINGTLVGYWFPDYMKEINMAGLHLHFISDDKNHAGHVLNCKFTNSNVQLDVLTNMDLVIPQNQEYQND